jgi:predicted DNA-binding mobile mystery protein A
MTRASRARERLDERLQAQRPLAMTPRPHRGWIRAIRDALGMSASELAARMGVTQQAVSALEESEHRDTIRLETLRRAAAALDCELAYVLLPRRTLAETVRARAIEQARRHLAWVSHHSRLEEQSVTDRETLAQIEALADQLIDRFGLWSEPEPPSKP